MASNHGDRMKEDTTQHSEALGCALDIFPVLVRDELNGINNNDPALTAFELDHDKALGFPDKAWELLGQFIANNTCLTHLDLYNVVSKMSALFNNLTGSRSIMKLSLQGNKFGLSTVQSMAPFLRNSPNLTKLDFQNNPNIDTDCFRVIVEAMDGSAVELLNFTNCHITDVRALANCNLPRLKEIYLFQNNIQSVPSLESCTSLETLSLGKNKIGIEGFRVLAKLLANNSLSLENMGLSHTGIDDEGAEVLANSLKHNTKLETLYLYGSDITEKGWGAFLKLLNDASSIEKAYKSNHTLRTISNDDGHLYCVSIRIKSALQINAQHMGNAHAAGRAKVIATQLNSTARKELCLLEGIDYSYGALFAGIDPVLLPDLLSLASCAHGQSVLYRMLVATGPDLVALIDKKSIIDAAIAYNTA